MSNRIYDGTRGALLTEEDDWFANVRQEPAEPDDHAWENELEWQLREKTAPDLGRRHAAIGLAVVFAAFLVVAGVLIGRETKGSNTKVVTVAAVSQTQETPAATGAGGSSAATSTTGAGTTASAPSSSVGTPSTGTGASASSTRASTPDASAVPTDQPLQQGAKGASVIALQNALTKLGYAAGTADGAYGAKTSQAVTAFQTAKGLKIDAIAGATTLAAINAALTSG